MSTFNDNILMGRFTNIVDIESELSFEELESSLLELAFDSQSISVYAYILYLIRIKESGDLHYLAYMVLFHSLNFLEGAYYTALYHAKTAVLLSPERIIYKENLLLFYELPEKLLSEEEAKIVIDDILKKNPTNELALNLLKDL